MLFSKYLVHFHIIEDPRIIISSLHKLSTVETNVSTIADICMTQSGTIFEGDVLIIYGPTYAKNLTIPAKTPIVHVDLVDSDGHMTIIVNITNQLINRFMTKLLLGATVYIKEVMQTIASS